MRKFFARLNPHVQTAAGWLAVIGTIMSGVYAALSKGAALFGELNWAEAILIGIGLTLATGLAVTALLAMGAYAFRLIRPLAPASAYEALPELDHELAPYEDAALKDRIASLEALTKKVAEVADGIMKSQGEVNDSVTERIDAADAAAKGARAYAEGLGVSIRDLLEGQAEARRERQVFQARMETWVGNLQRKIRYGLVSADNAFAAILDRENMQKLAAKIEVVRDELSGPTEKKEPMGDRNAWLAKYGGWYRNLEAWARLGEKHRLGTIKRVFAITDSDYEGTWEATDDLFSSSIDVHKYKTFRIYSRNFFAEREAVERCVEQAAFVHPSQRPQPVLDEEDDDDQPYIPPPRT